MTPSSADGDTGGMPHPIEPEPVTNHYATGALQSAGWNLEGDMHGDWTFYRKDGSMMRSGSFDRGRQVGIWRTFDREGTLVKETDFGGGA